MGISRDSRHKHRATGGRVAVHQKKRKYELGRCPSNTKLGVTRVHDVRVRGGAIKQRALRLDHGYFSWASEGVCRKTKITAVVYNATSNEMVRTNTLTKGTIIVVDATPFRQWYFQHYEVEIARKRGNAVEEVAPAATEKPKELTQREKDRALKLKTKRAARQKLDPILEEQLASGRVFARISSRPGQVGKADGYLLEGRELEFYKKKLDKKKSK